MVLINLASILASIIGAYISTGSLIETWKWITETFSPFNIWNTILTIILAIPGVIAFHLAEKFK